MKKLIAALMGLCLILTAAAAVADMEIPTFDSMPGVVLEDENTTVEEAAFQGDWVLRAAFAGEEYVDEQTLAGVYGFNFMPYRIADGKILQDEQDANGEFHTVELPYVFEAGQLQGTDAQGHGFAVELLEDGSIVLSTFYPGEGDEVICLSVFLVHPAEEAE